MFERRQITDPNRVIVTSGERLVATVHGAPGTAATPASRQMQAVERIHKAYSTTSKNAERHKSSMSANEPSALPILNQN